MRYAGIKRLFPFVSLLVVIAVFAALIFTASAARSETITVGVPVDRCPIFYSDPATGEPTGIGVDLMRFASEKAGYSARFVFVSENTLKAALDNPDYDVILPFGSAITSASGSRTVVSENLFQTPFTLVSNAGQLPPLGSLRVGMLRSLGGAVETLGVLYPDMEINLYDTMAESVKALRRGEVDALLHNSYVWSYVLQKPSYGDLSVKPSTVFSMDFRAGTPDTPEGRELIERLNRGISSLSDTRRQAVILDYTSRSLYKYDLSDYIYMYGMIIVLAILLFAAIVIIAMQRFRALKRRQEEDMRRLLDHDELTGVLSINGFRKRVEELLREHPDTQYFLSYNNIRNFKYINDSLGRKAGDDLLRYWTKLSMDNLSSEEAIGRVSGDRFAVLRRITGDAEMRADEKRIFEPLHNYFIAQGKDNRVQISSGIYVLTPKDYRKIDVDHMLDMARVAEKKARESRKGDYSFYNPEQWERGKRVADIINYLPKALACGDIQVWYQPQVDYATGTVTGAEALCRWDHSKLGWLQPAGFIETLEDAGLIYDLDYFVWNRVCSDLSRWNAEGHRRSVSVNVSRDDIREDRDIAEIFRSLVEAHGLSPSQLHVEITETAYVENPGILIDTTERLRALGFSVEMDDFGSGYSSLHMLKEVPVDRIKLDLHFLTSSGDPVKSRTIVSCMVNMVGELGMEMIAEGVETLEQADFLRGRGCTQMQGYYFYKPMPREEYEILLTDEEKIRIHIREREKERLETND